MKKKLYVNRSNYILLEFVYLLEYLNFDDDIKKKIIDLRNYLEDKLFSNFLKSNNSNSIIDEKCILEFTFE